MKTKILLDTNFIIACIIHKIDILDGLRRLFYLYDTIIPKQVMHELKELSQDEGAKREDREAAMVALEILRNKKVIFLDLNESNTDKGIINFAEANKNVVVATLDRELKNSMEGKARILVVRDKKKMEIV